MTLRECPHCGKQAHTVANLEAFTKDSRRRYGRMNVCKDCSNRWKRAYKRRNREEVQRKNREYMTGVYHPAHASILRKKARDYRQRFPERICAGNKTRSLKTASHCQECGGEERLEKHHPDYSQPELFVTLCASCHRQLHIGVGDAEASP